MTMDDRIAALKAGKLRLDCVEMELVQDGVDNPIHYRGKGYIEQTSDGGLTMKVYSTEHNADVFGSFEQHITAGRFLPKTEFYSLKAVAIDGVEWTASGLYPDCTWLARHPNPVVTAEINVLAHEFALPGTGYRTRIDFFDEVDLPFTDPVRTITPFFERSELGSAEFTAGDYEFTFKKRGEDAFVVEVSSSKAHPPDLLSIVQGGLGYALAKSVQWRACQSYDGTTVQTKLRALRGKSVQGRLRPPVPLWNVERSWFWLHLARFFGFALSPDDADRAATCSLQLLSARESSAVSTMAWAVGVSLAVEGLSNLIRVERSARELETLDELKAYVLSKVGAEAAFAPYLLRLDGLLSILKNERVRDRLEVLVRSGHTRQALAKAWTDLRNKHVHPTGDDYRQFAEGEYQKLIDLINSTTVLMYHIVFHTIGYEGKYTDYSVYGYPTAAYPLPPNSAS